MELLRGGGAGGASGVELGRRWLAALFLAPAHERQAIVEAVEARMAALYPLEPLSTIKPIPTTDGSALRNLLHANNKPLRATRKPSA